MCRIEMLDTASLFPAAYNPREADPARLELVRLSLQKLGFVLPLVATLEGEILSGHQRHTAAMHMGVQRVPVLRVDIPKSKRRGLNILFNRATNDIDTIHTEQHMTEALVRKNVQMLAATLPDITPNSPDFNPCCKSVAMDVIPLAQKNVAHFIRHAGNVGRMLARMHVNLPIVVTEDGTVVNGIGRLEAAARKGKQHIHAVTLEPHKAALARAMLNLLSMNFCFTGENADFLRYGAYRRSWLRRSYLGTAFVLPVFKSRRNADFDLNNPVHLSRWQATCGNTVLDFGSGHGDEAAMLRKAGVDVTTFEPYPAKNNKVSREAGRHSALEFLAAVRRKKSFSTVFISSVLNSVPFPEDREHVVRICAALCGPQTVLIAAARSKYGSNWKNLTTGTALSHRGGRDCTFKLASEDGAVIGDISNSPKIQKFFSCEEFNALFSRYFSVVTIGKKSSGVTAMCKGTRPVSPQKLAASLRFEFNLPYPCGKRMGLVKQALEAFSARLGFDLGAI